MHCLRASKDRKRSLFALKCYESFSEFIRPVLPLAAAPTVAMANLRRVVGLTTPNFYRAGSALLSIPSPLSTDSI